MVFHHTFGNLRLLWFGLNTASLLALASAEPEAFKVHDDAGWCWFQEERALIVGDKLVFGSVASGRSSDGGADKSRRGNIELTQVNLTDRSTGTAVLEPRLQGDDHNVPALWLRSDERLLALFAKHGNDKIIRSRISAPGDFLTWPDKRDLEPMSDLEPPSKMGITYNNLFSLEGAGESGALFINFFRGDAWNPNWMTSDDEGSTWRYRGRIIANSADGKTRRPYVRYAGNGKRIDLVYTFDHPRAHDNSLYHIYLTKDGVFNSTGRICGFDDLPVGIDQGTVIYEGDKNHVAWCHDVVHTSDGQPVVAFQTQRKGAGLPEGKGGLDHRFHYAMFDSEEWRHSEYAFGGSRLYPREDDYTGLAAIDPNNPTTIYFSTNVNPTDGKPLISSADGEQHHELFRAITPDQGNSWNITPLSQNSKADNLRPIVPSHPGRPPHVLFLRGKLTTYTDYDLDAWLLIDSEA